MIEANLKGNRRLVVEHKVRRGRRLEPDATQRVLEMLASLWGYRVRLRETCTDTGRVLGEQDAIPGPG